METPYFLIKEDELQKNINNFKNALLAFWPNSAIAYSVKTNSLPWVLQYMKTNSVLAEVVSDEEYELAKRCGYSDEYIVFNGPIKSREFFNNAIQTGAIVNIDSQRELEWIEEADYGELDRIGLRVNFNLSKFCPNDIDYNDDGHRFGFSYELGALKDAFERIASLSHKNLVGLHLHCNSITRSPTVYGAIARCAADIVSDYKLELEYLDIGGGFYGGIKGMATPDDYIKTIAHETEGTINRNKTKLIIEPGSAFIGSAVRYCTNVLDVKDTALSRIVTTDGSRLHIDPLWKKQKYSYTILSKSQSKAKKQIICGYTCMDHDRIMTLINECELMVGDTIIYNHEGAYSMTLGGMFIKYLPDVYVETYGAIKQIRKRISVEDYYRIQDCQ